MSRFSEVVTGLRKVARRFQTGRERHGSHREPGLFGLRRPRLEPLEDRLLLSIDTEIRRAVVVGISNYQNLTDLNYRDDDAQAFYDKLLTDRRWQASNITLLKDLAATKSAIQTAMTDLANACDSDDLAVVFFAGRGFRLADQAPIDEEDGYDEVLAPADAIAGNYATMISDDELLTMLQAVAANAASVSVFLDCDYSGGVIGDFSGSVTPGFWVNYYKANVQVTHLSVAEQVINTPSMQSYMNTEVANVINYTGNDGGEGHYSPSRPVPGETAPVDDYVIEAFSTITIPTAGDWTFGVNSDDGFSLEITGYGQRFFISYPDPRAPGDTLGVFTVNQAGDYDVRLVMYERGGGSEVELFAAPGSHTSWNASDFDLVGDVANGGLRAVVPGSVVPAVDRLVALAACAETEVAREDPALAHGFFTYYLLEGMDSKLTNTDPDFLFIPGTPGFMVTTYRANQYVSNFQIAESVVRDASRQRQVEAEIRPWINYVNTGGTGRYGSDYQFQGMRSDTDVNDFVIEARSRIYIPSGGEWTFGVNSDDGFRLRIPGVTFTDAYGQGGTQVFDDTLQFLAPRGPNDSLGVCTVPVAGYYDLELLMYERGGGAEVELWAAPGHQTAWNATDFDLVGDTANGGLAATTVPGGAYWISAEELFGYAAPRTRIFYDEFGGSQPRQTPQLYDAKSFEADFFRAPWMGPTQTITPLGTVMSFPSADGWFVKNYKANVQISHVYSGTYNAEQVISTPSLQSWVRQEVAQVVNYRSTGGSQNFGDDSPFPGLRISADDNDFVIEAVGIITIPTAGTYAFGANGDDGWRFTMTGPAGTFSFEDPATHGSRNITAVFDITQAGDYSARFVWFERGGGAQVELKAAYVPGLRVPPGVNQATSFYDPIAGGTISDLGEAEVVVANPSLQAWNLSENVSVFNYLNTGGAGHYGNDRTVPGMTIGTDVNNYVVVGTGTIRIPAAGRYTFGVNSDDGFIVTIPGATFVWSTPGGANGFSGNSFWFNGGRGASDSLGQADFPAAGDYPFRVLWFEGTGGSAGEFFAAQGAYTSWNANSFHLVGDTGAGGLEVPGGFTVTAYKQQGSNLWDLVGAVQAGGLRVRTPTPWFTMEGGWAFGDPLGNGGPGGSSGFGAPDPNDGVMDHTYEILGYDFANGNYGRIPNPEYLTSAAIDCTDRYGTVVRFQRWLGVENSDYDQARFYVSTNGTNWTQVWANPNFPMSDDQWNLVEYDISAIADNQPTVYLRWQMGPTDFWGNFCGWNLDNIELRAFTTGPAPTLTSISQPVLQINRTADNVTVSGSNFRVGAQVRIVRSGYPTIWADEVFYNSASQLTFDLNLNGVAPGVYDVQVVNADGSVATLSGGLKLEGEYYYVNDGSTVNDQWCTAVGDDANDGRSPARPKATVQAILATYDLEPGDVVYIDTGTYSLASNIEVTTEDQGSPVAPVEYRASPYGVLFDRGDMNPGSYGWYFNSSYATLYTVTSTKYNNVAQQWLEVTGANAGIVIAGSNITLDRVDSSDNAFAAVHVRGDNADNVTLEHLIAQGLPGLADASALRVTGADGLVLRNSTIIAAKYGVLLEGTGSIDSPLFRNNIAVADGAGNYCIYLAATINSPSSDYNDLYASGGAFVGGSPLGDMPTLDAWQLGTGQDLNSISADPRFAGPAIPNGVRDFHVLSNGGRYDPSLGLPPEVGGAWVVDSRTSPVIDKGDPFSPYLLEPLPNGDRVNMGAYANSEQASRTDVSTPVVTSYWLEEDRGPSSTDQITNDTDPVLTFVFSEVILGTDTDVVIADPLGNPVIPVSITGWDTDTLVVTLPALSVNGQYTVTLDGTMRDTYGNPFNPAAWHFTLDTIAATLIDFTVTEDTGVSGDDQITSDTTPTLTFVFDEPIYEPGSVTVVGRSGGPVTPDSISGWGTNTLVAVFDPTSLADDIYDVTITGQDIGGNPVNPPVQTFVIDATPPAVPGDPDLQPGSDTGVSDTDNITADTTPTFDVISTDEFFRFYRGGERVSGDYESGTTYTAGPEVDGTYLYQLSAVDRAGNESGLSLPGLGVTIDTVSPTVTSYTLVEDNGPSSTDQITNDTTPVLTFVFDEVVHGVDADVTVIGPSGPVTPDSISGWGSDTLVITFSTPLAEGLYEVTLNASSTVTDTAGNPLNGGVNQEEEFRLDLT
ncbi:MAG: Ig-like domain-containing protein, partial [Thermoguttaceae bacterium]